MKKILLNTCFLLAAAMINAQAPTFAWAKGMGASSYDWGLAMTNDAAGNVYTTGFFQNTVDFDPGAGTSTLSASGIDIFIQKLDVSGNFLWAKKISSSGEDKGNAITLDASGNVYVTGYYSGTADFDPGAGTFTMGTAGVKDIFVLKLDASGNFGWAKKMGGSSFDLANSIALDAGGNVYTCGSFYGTVDFDPGVGTATLASPGNDDIFISKLDASGNFVWVQQMGSASTDQALALTLDAAGNVYSTGSFQGTVDLDPGAGTATFAAFSQDIFVSKLDASGSFVWGKTMSGSAQAIGNSIALDASANVYLTGVMQGTVDFDPGAGTFTLSQTGVMMNSPDIFVSKLDASGNFVWAKSMGGQNHDSGNSIFVDGPGNVYLTGHFQTTCDFDPGAGTFTMTTTGQEPYIEKLDASGNFVWVKNFYGTGSGEGFSIRVDAQGTIYNTGAFTNTMDFDPGAGVANLNGNVTDDIYVVKLTVGGVGLQNATALENSISIYPNPSSTTLIIELSELCEGSTIEIRNALGNLLKKLKIAQSLTTVDVSDLSIGIYFVSIEQNNIRTTRKLIKE
jgi:hypothetical protein